MVRLQAFRTAPREGGFVEVEESAEETILWLRKSAPPATRDMDQSMCIDSATGYWMAVPGKVNSKTFRGVPALQEWLKLDRKRFSSAEKMIL